MKRSIALFICNMLLITFTSCSEIDKRTYPIKVEEIKYETGTDLNTEFKIENKHVLFSYNAETNRFTITDKLSATLWKDALDIPKTEIKGVKRDELMSHLVIEYINKSEKTLFVNSNTASTSKKDYKAVKLSDGVRITYSFASQGFEVPVEYRITQDGFTATILYDSIKETDNNRIISIKLLPAFGAADINDNGYMVVPDGCGALINLNNGKSNMLPYEQQVYGRDYFQNISFKTVNTKNALMPLFGMKKNNAAYAAVITKGDALSTINASVSGPSIPYNTIGNQFLYRAYSSDVFQVLTNSIETRYINLFAKRPVSLPQVQIRYYLLSGDRSNYVGMAKAYQSYLIENQNFKKKSITSNVNLQLVGSVRSKKHFAGIPYDGIQTLTTYSESGALLEQLTNSNASNIDVSYINWYDPGQYGKVQTSYRYSSRLGGKKAYDSFNRAAGKYGIGVYKVIEPLQFVKSGNGFSRLNNSIRNLLDSVAYQYNYDIAVYDKLKNQERRVLLSPRFLNAQASALFDNAEKSGENAVAFLSIGSMIYSDYSKDFIIDRDETLAYYKQFLDSAADVYKKIMIFGGNAYGYPYATVISNLDISDSQFDICDQTIPLVQLVLKGYVNYTTSPLNLEGDYPNKLLRAIEYGANPTYVLISRDTALLKKSYSPELFGTDFNAWKSEIIRLSKIQKEIQDAVHDSEISGHEKIADGVYRTVYKNKAAVYVNYNENDVIAGNISVKAKSYKIVVGGEQIASES